MGWYENQKARNEAAKERQRQAKERCAETRENAAEASRVTAPLPVTVPAERVADPVAPAWRPEAVGGVALQVQTARAVGRLEKLYRLEMWIAGIQLVAVLIPVVLFLVFAGWVAWMVLL